MECAHIFMSSCRCYKQGLRFITTRRNKQVLISQGCIARMRKIHGHYIYYIITDILCDIACSIWTRFSSRIWKSIYIALWMNAYTTELMENFWDFLLVAMVIVVWTICNNSMITKDVCRLVKKSSKSSNGVRPITWPNFPLFTQHRYCWNFIVKQTN